MAVPAAGVCAGAPLMCGKCRVQHEQLVAEYCCERRPIRTGRIRSLLTAPLKYSPTALASARQTPAIEGGHNAGNYAISLFWTVSPHRMANQLNNHS